eukprot:NODE_2172_length_635_cov_46.726378_g2122_i0.p1 GENE.NODE_2172_length_635_cov_46.726378_g2122_i0~~NODE_2172_length_635_cov_46.726378_g2122_i0.p1  ORF type:complete len:119 (+),score=8.56 NODE_2172_length_635_cov_46.726378_g2122_i0:119-475(+)
MVNLTIAVNTPTLLTIHFFLALLASLVADFHYNLPIFVMGLWAWNLDESILAIKLFCGALFSSIILDIIVMAIKTGTNGVYIFCLIVTIINLVIKPVSLFFSVRHIRQAGFASIDSTS